MGGEAAQKNRLMHIIKDPKGSFFASVERACDEIDPNWRQLEGLLVAGRHAIKDLNLEEALEEIRKAREAQIPTLGICFGLQLMVIEYARNVLGLVGANSTEIDPATPHPVVSKLPGFRTGIYPVGVRQESHWHQYAVNNEYLLDLSNHFRTNMTGDVVEMMYLPKDRHPFYLGVQFHPEYQSSKENPHPVLLNFISCKKNT